MITSFLVIFFFVADLFFLAEGKKKKISQFIMVLFHTWRNYLVYEYGCGQNIDTMAVWKDDFEKVVKVTGSNAREIDQRIVPKKSA